MPCQPPKSNADKIWSVYDQYYRGERDDVNRKNGHGLNHWSGTKSLEWYEGRMLRDTMHGNGEYCVRYHGGNHTAVTYEGHFYNNTLHGYGVMSYPDGRVFNGLFYKNVRWGPGIVSHANLREDVGLWHGTQLVRLAWRPPVPSVAIDLASTPVGRDTITPHRIQLCSNVKTIGEVNSAFELLKHYGTEPLVAAEKWSKLYPKNCTDTESQLCHVQVFDSSYYNEQINTLIEDNDAIEKNEDTKTYYAWNDNEIIIHMMKHCYKHENQRANTGIKLMEILSGNRKFKTAGKHELDCRTLLMASYLGHIANVAQLVNENDVNPNVTDMQGNSAIMYAACGDQPDIIHFLIEAGAEVDYYNDACCTPLGVSLLRFALARWDIAPSDMLQALLPPPPPPGAPPEPPAEDSPLEWQINRELPLPTGRNSINLQRIPSKGSKLTKNSSQKDLMEKDRKKNQSSTFNVPKDDEADEAFTEEKRLFLNISNEYLIRVNEAFTLVTPMAPVPYLFEVADLTKDLNIDDEKKPQEKHPKKVTSKLMKDAMRPSRDMMWQSFSKEDNNLMGSKEQMMQDKLGRIMLTILQLLSEGADPKKVCCPQPPIFIATVAGCSELITHLVNNGANVNDPYPNAHGYTPLDIAVGGPLSEDNLEVIRSLLQNGAKTDHRLHGVIPPETVNQNLRPSLVVAEPQEDDSPTLLHAVLARQVENDSEEEIRRQLLELLLEYGCNPIIQSKGRSAVDVAMGYNMDIFDIFIKSPATDLNAVINSNNQNILIKMFHLPYSKTLKLSEWLQTLTNLMLFGADPLLKCQIGDEHYDNLFVYAKKNLTDLEVYRKSSSPQSGTTKSNKKELKGKKSEKIKKEDKPVVKGHSKATVKLGAEDFADYKQALDLVVECARLLYIRWLQAKLLKQLIEIVNKYNHRQWNMIIKEHKNKKCTGLWLSAARALEIWDVLKTTKRNVYKNNRILKHTLCIVHYYYKKTRKLLDDEKITAKQKAQIEMEVSVFIREYKLATMSTPDMVPAIRPYVAPELTVKGLEKFNVCFECAMPLTDTKIQCISCKLISFCTLNCIKINIDRINCHPCSSYLKEKLFPSSPLRAEENATATTDV